MWYSVGLSVCLDEMKPSDMSAADPYMVPAAPAVFEEEIKKSHFITYLAHTPSVEQAKAFVQQIKDKHHDARHNCWAFVAGRPEDSMQWGFSDDGEPSGTAGKPILAQLTGSGVGEITAVVTRYSGGIKLGTGGLVKAYGGGVQQALTVLQTKEKIITSELALCCEYNQVSLVETLLAEVAGQQVHADYGQQVTMVVALDRRLEAEFCAKLVNRSGGQIVAKAVDGDAP
ncbi:YigZ family protein [Photobacterium aphoticum]|uniref:Protein co-occurring with transport systems n=3 Tax=Photobacterium aphoticum TaxID=754436 RepID=A0A090R1M2_9GAMM|nr:hypothetical protein JCM19237_6751 [Photobacterium aphoticum]GHA61829.1 YigZ family protein [Photobacterium aphoticum]